MGTYTSAPATTPQHDPYRKPFSGGNVCDRDAFFSGEEEMAYSNSGAGKSEEPAVRELSPEKATAFREELRKLFDVFDDKVVGDAEFDDIITEEKWKEHKEDEAAKKKSNDQLKHDYDVQLAQWNMSMHPTDATKPPKPDIKPVKIYTTCIDTQRKLLEKALQASGLKVRKVLERDDNGFVKPEKKKVTTYAYGSLGPQQAAELGAWHPASRGMTERPKVGDILVLAFRGKEVDKAAGDIANMDALIHKADELGDAIKDFEEKAQAARQALQTAQDSGDAQQIKEAKQKMIEANNLFDNAKRKAKKAADEAKGSRQLMPSALKKLDKKRAEANHERFEFSHVGYFISSTPNANGTETWTTFDGGQTLDTAGGKKQGAGKTPRIYDPKTNEIAGEKTQDGYARWLQGWVDTEKLAEAQ